MKKKLTLLLLPVLVFALSCSKDNDLDEGDMGDPAEEITPEEVPGREKDYLLGSLFSFQRDLRAGKIEGTATTFYNLPLYDARLQESEEEWWDNLVEEFDYAGLDYVAANCRGILPDPNKYLDHGDPNHLKELVAAMERRGLQDKFKIAIFDDCPSSWQAARNKHLYDSYVTDRGKYPYPLDALDDDTDQGIYKYIWDYNIKIAFESVPKKYWLRFHGKPVLILWSVNTFVDNKNDGTPINEGKLSAILNRIRSDFNSTFGEDVFIIADKSFQDRDKTVYAPVVDAFNDWFGMDNPYTVRRHNGRSIGVGVPGFSVNDLIGNHMFIDANHGKTLTDNLTNMVNQDAELILIEGFVDVAENAALWRSIDTKYYDYPNQRLNIMKQFSKEPFPADLKLEAEGCDYYEDKSSGNSGGAYRQGDLDVAKCNDTYGGWAVVDAQEGEWLEWKAVPLRKKSRAEIRYRSDAPATIRYVIDGENTESVQLPATHGQWSTVSSADILFDDYRSHELKLEVLSGEHLSVNYIQFIAE